MLDPRVGEFFEDVIVNTTFETYEQYTRWSGVGRHQLDGSGCLQADKTQPDRGGTDNHPCVLFYMKAEYPLRGKSLLLRQMLVMPALQKRMFPEALTDCAMSTGDEEDMAQAENLMGRNHISVGLLGISHVRPTHQHSQKGVEEGRLFAELWSLYMHGNKVIFQGRMGSVDSVVHDMEGGFCTMVVQKDVSGVQYGHLCILGITNLV